MFINVIIVGSDGILVPSLINLTTIEAFKLETRENKEVVVMVYIAVDDEGVNYEHILDNTVQDIAEKVKLAGLYVPLIKFN